MTLKQKILRLARLNREEIKQFSPHWQLGAGRESLRLAPLISALADFVDSLEYEPARLTAAIEKMERGE